MAFPIGAVLAAGSSLAGTLGSIYSANRQNAIAQNQFKQSMDWQKYQYNDMKRYNSPSNQIALMRDAGINPALAIGQLPSSAAVGSSAPASTSSMVQPDFSGLQSLADIAQNYELIQSEKAKNFADASNTAQDTIGKEVDNAWKEKNYKLAYSLQQAQWDLADLEYSFQVQSFQDRLQKQHSDSLLSQADAKCRLIAAAWAPKEHSAEYSKVLQETAVLKEQKELTNKQAREVLMRTIASFGMDENDAKRLFDASLDVLNSTFDVNTSNAYRNFSEKVDWAKFGPASIGTSAAPNAAGKVLNRYHNKYNR